MNNEYLKEMLKATNKCLDLAKDIKSVDDLQKNTFYYDNILTNLLYISEIYHKLDEKTKLSTNIEWEKFNFYEDKLLDVKEKLNLELIFKIITEELPILQKKLNSYFNASEV